MCVIRSVLGRVLPQMYVISDWLVTDSGSLSIPLGSLRTGYLQLAWSTLGCIDRMLYASSVSSDACVFYCGIHKLAALI
jgi:hypothetical protein